MALSGDRQWTSAPDILASFAIWALSVDTQMDENPVINHHRIHTLLTYLLQKIKGSVSIIYLLPNSRMTISERLSNVVPFILAKFFWGMPLLPPLARINAATCCSLNVSKWLQPWLILWFTVLMKQNTEVCKVFKLSGMICHVDQLSYRRYRRPPCSFFGVMQSTVANSSGTA